VGVLQLNKPSQNLLTHGVKSIEVMSHSTPNPSVGVQIVLDGDNGLDWWRALPSSTQIRSFKWLLIAIHKFISNDLPFGTPFALDASDRMALLLAVHQYCKDTRSAITWPRGFHFTDNYNILENELIVWEVDDDAEPFDDTLVQALMEEFLVNVNRDLLMLLSCSRVNNLVSAHGLNAKPATTSPGLHGKLPLTKR
jgi:hypothetical protein